MVKRGTLIVLDSLGIGQLPDAENYGDKGADTLGHIVSGYPQFSIPNLQKLGFGNIHGAAGGAYAVSEPAGSFGKLKELSKGKDTITGHWEIAGLRTDVPFKTYPDGFPAEFISQFEEAIGREVIGNCTASGTVIIEELGPEHEATGKPIVYTSADSVFQIAVNTDMIPLEELYRICETARGMLQGEWAGQSLPPTFCSQKMISKPSKWRRNSAHSTGKGSCLRQTFSPKPFKCLRFHRQTTPRSFSHPTVGTRALPALWLHVLPSVFACQP